MNYTWIELPVIVFAFEHSRKYQTDFNRLESVKLSRNELTYLSHICSMVDEAGFISSENHAIAFQKAGYQQSELKQILLKFEEFGLMFHGKNRDGQYVQYADNRQSLALFGEKLNEHGENKRILIPLELVSNEKLSLEELAFIGMVCTYERDSNGAVNAGMFIAKEIIAVAMLQCGKNQTELRKILHRLESLKFIKLGQDPDGIILLPTERNVFISYCHRDIKYLNEMKRHFHSLPDLSLEVWDDGDIQPGEEWELSIFEAMEQADVAVILISPDFLSSKFIREKELPKLLALNVSGLKIIGVMLVPCLIDYYPELSKFQFINPIDNPVAQMKRIERENIWVSTVFACMNFIDGI